MNYKNISILASALSFLNGVFFLLAPAFSLSILGRDTNLAGILSMRFFGACALGLAVIAWMARLTPHPEVRRFVSWGMFTTLLLLAAIDLHGTLTGAVNLLGWLLFTVDLMLSLGFLWSIFTAGRSV
jgi:hypothetical protein